MRGHVMNTVQEVVMKKIILTVSLLLGVLTGCTNEQNITFTAQIESLSGNSIVVTTEDDVGFDKASVSISTLKAEEMSVGDQVEITIKPEIRESYPVQVTAVSIEVLKGKYHKITAEEAKKIIDKEEYGTILDVRTVEEYNEGHIQNALLLPSNELADKAETTLLDKEQVILVYCRSGRRSEAAAKQLIEMGYTNVYDFGGIIDWPYEIVKE